MTVVSLLCCLLCDFLTSDHVKGKIRKEVSDHVSEYNSLDLDMNTFNEK
jgi:hypothetical protein